MSKCSTLLRTLFLLLAYNLYASCAVYTDHASRKRTTASSEATEVERWQKVQTTVHQTEDRVCILEYNLPSCTAEEKFLGVNSASEGTGLDVYHDGGDLVKICKSSCYAMGKCDVSYYWLSGALLCVKKDGYDYDAPFYAEEGFKVNSVSRGRYYFQDGKLAVWIKEDGTLILPGSLEFEKEETSVLNDTQEVISASQHE